MDSATFIQKIDKDLAHRKVELTTLLLMVKEQNPDASRLSCTARSAVALCYAHWEGFIKQGSTAYIKYVNAANVAVSDLKLPLQAAYISSAFKRALDSNRSDYLGEILGEIDRRRTEKFAISPEKCIDTESNLSSTIFRSIVKGVGLEVLPVYDTRSNFIDQRIVYARNQVVHGELVRFDADDVEDRVKGVFLLVDTYADQLKDAVESQSYLR